MAQREGTHFSDLAAVKIPKRGGRRRTKCLFAFCSTTRLVTAMRKLTLDEKLDDVLFFAAGRDKR